MGGKEVVQPGSCLAVVDVQPPKFTLVLVLISVFVLLAKSSDPPLRQLPDLCSRDVEAEVGFGEATRRLSDDEQGTAACRWQLKLVDAIEPGLKHKERCETGEVIRVRVDNMDRNAGLSLDGDGQFKRAVRLRPEQLETGVLFEKPEFSRLMSLDLSNSTAIGSE